MNGINVALVAILTSIVTAASTVIVIERLQLLPRQQAAPPTPQVTVPNFVGLSETDARDNAKVAHLSLLIAGREPSAEAKPGSVIKQSIVAGQKIPQDHPLSVVIAEEAPKVPTVTGMTLADAKAKLEQKGFLLKEGTSVAHPTVPAGSVISQSPDGDTPSVKGSPITVQLSSGPGEVAVPKLVGVNVAKAQKDLEALGLKAQLRWIEMAETPTMVVLSQKPAAGEKVKPGSEIQLTIVR